MPLELICLMVIVGWSVTLTVLERFYPYDPGQKILRPGFWMDFLWYTLIQSFVLGILIATLIQAIDHSSGLSRLGLVSHWPLWVQFVFFWITHDFWQYWFHRIQHRHRVLWRTHEAAHATPEVDWLVGSRSHAFEILIAQTMEFAPIILLGAAPEEAVLKGTFDAVWGMYNHSNLKISHGILIYVFNGPQMHRWHHALNLPKGGANFATKLSLWDWLFGTAHLPKGDKPAGYGLKNPDYPNYSYFGQWKMVFRTARKPGSGAFQSGSKVSNS